MIALANTIWSAIPLPAELISVNDVIATCPRALNSITQRCPVFYFSYVIITSHVVGQSLTKSGQLLEFFSIFLHFYGNIRG